MNFVSLGEKPYTASFGEALRQGTAPDGSLYFPDHIPMLNKGELANLHGATMAETAEIILPHWVGDEIPARDLDGIIKQAATFETPLHQVGDKQVLELFHGPTMAFKDVAARYLAALMSYYNGRDGYESTVLVATSGDTGGAIAHGFANIPGVKVAVLFPKGRVSELQEKQLTHTAPNVSAFEVAGSFDDCQALVKQALGDAALKDLHLSSANSISVGRLIPQTLYYANAFGQLGNTDHVRIVVPTGNLGNLTAGIITARMGLPIERFLAANNRNNALASYLTTGVFRPFRSIETLSNAMDVGSPNNFPRFRELFGGHALAASRFVSSATINDLETVRTIKEVREQYGYLLDPHTAVAWAASERVPFAGTDIIVSTASPIKFSKEIMRATGIEISNSAELAALDDQPKRVKAIKNNYREFVGVLGSI